MNKKNHAFKIKFFFFLLIGVFAFFGRGAPTAFATTIFTPYTTTTYSGQTYSTWHAFGANYLPAVAYDTDSTSADYGNPVIVAHLTDNTGGTNVAYGSNVHFGTYYDSNISWTSTGYGTTFEIFSCEATDYYHCDGTGEDMGYSGYATLATLRAGGANIHKTYVTIVGGVATFSGSTSTQVFEFSTPTDTSTLEDFGNWQVHIANVTDTDPYSSIVILYSDDSTLLTTCDDFPVGHGYTTCTNGNPRIWYDESPQFSGGIFAEDTTFPIIKNHPFITGTTYYAKAYLRSPDIMSATNVTTSNKISFTIGIPTNPVPTPGTCGTLDIACYLQNFMVWFLGANNSVLNQFGNLNLTTKFPFSYIADIGVLWAEAFNQSANSFSISIPFLGHTFNLISTTQLNAISFEPLVKTIMSAIAMFFTAMFIYKKVIKIHDQGHQTV